MQDRQPPHTARVWGFGGIMKFSDYAKLKMKNIILRESLLSKSDYERRERNLRIRNAENAEILTKQGFEKEQIDAIEQFVIYVMNFILMVQKHYGLQKVVIFLHITTGLMVVFGKYSMTQVLKII